MKYLFMILVMCVACSPQATPPPNATPIEPTEEPFYAWDFTLEATDGNTYTLSEQRGKWVVINFWATWCIPCIEEMPVLQEIATIHPDDLIILGINQREEKSAVIDFAESLGINFPLLLNPDDGVLTNYQVLKQPQTVIVDPKGELVWRQFGPIDLETFEATLAQLFEAFSV